MAKRNNREYLKGEIVLVKKYFYVLRPLFACMWIQEKHTSPPMEFMHLLNALTIDKTITIAVKQLYQRKVLGEELGKEHNIQCINDFLNEKIQYFECYLRIYIPKQQAKTDIEVLDSILREILLHEKLRAM